MKLNPTRQSWDEWKQTLARAVQHGQSAGMSQEEIRQRAQDLGDLLAHTVDPANPEQKVLAELWNAADQQEQQALASTIVKMVSGGPKG